jgi:WD40 repeat protein
MYFAVGTLLGKSIVIYEARTCQEVKRLSNGESVMSLTFGKTGKFLASAGPKSVKVWAVDTWTLVTHIPTPVRCVSLELIENDDLLIIAMRNNLLIFWDIDKDCVNDELRWTLDPAAIADYDMRVPMSITVSRTQGLLAASYRSQDLLVWNLAEDMVHDIYCRVTNGSRLDDPLGRREKSTVLAMAFSEGPDSSALLASYFDGELVLYDTKNGSLRHRLSGVNAQCMSSSPDGRTLATGDAAGTIQIFDLETLKFLYRINFNAEFIGVRALSFTSDGQRLLDLRGRQCRAWEPVVLLRQEVAEPAADTMSLSASAQEVDFEGPMDIVYITAVAIIQTGSLQTGNLVLYGTDDGAVYLYDPIRGEKMEQLFKNDIAITFLSYDAESGIIVCTDQSSRVVCRRLIISRSSALAAEVVFEVQLENAIMQVLVNYGATRLLVSTADESVLFALDSGSQNSVSKISWQGESDSFCWVATTSSNDKLVLCRGGRAYTYLWDTLTRCGSFPEGIPAEDDTRSFDAGATLEGTGLFNKVVQAKAISDSEFFATTSEDTRFGKIKTEVWLWKFDAFAPGTSTIQPVQGLEELKSSIDHVIGTYLNRFIFLHSNGWVCSTSLDTPDAESLVQHFFIPSDWLSLSHRPLIDVLPSGDIVFAKKSEMVVIKSGLGLSRRSLTSRHSSQSSVGRPSGLRRRSSPGGQSGLSRRQLSPSGFSMASTLVGGGRSLRHGSLPDRSKLDEGR